MNKLITGLLVTVVMVSMTGCAKEKGTSPQGPNASVSPPANVTAPKFTVGPAPLPLPLPSLPPRATPADFPLVVNTVIEKQYYLPGQPVKMTVYITNVGPDNVTFAQFPPEITITADEDDRKITLAKPGVDSFQLQPGFLFTYNLTWDQQGENGIQVPTGWYLITVANVNFVRGDPPRGTRANWGSQRIDIQPLYPQGVLVKDIKPNLSQVVNGNNVTLRHISLTENGSSFEFFCVPDNYSYSRQVSNVEATAEYTINGTTRNAGFAGYGDDTTSGIRLVWGQNNPLQIVPKDAKEIIFTINSIVVRTYEHKQIDLGGPWEFKIPLQ